MVALASIEDVQAVTATPVPTDNIGDVARLIEICSARVIRKINKGPDPFTQKTETVTVYANSTGELFLPGLNITAVSSVTLYGTALTASMYRFTPSGRLLRVRGQGSVSGYFDGLGWDDAGRGSSIALDDWGWPVAPITVAYTHGWPVGGFPDDIAGVVAELVAAKYLGGESRATGVIGEQITSGNDSYRVQFYKNEPAAWHPEHLEIINSYRKRIGSFRLVDAGGSPARTW